MELHDPSPQLTSVVKVIVLRILTGYDPDDSTLLAVAKELRDSSEQLYDSMGSIAKKATATTKPKGKK
jgi:hypothetical protein